ncbi:MAG TPA: hypothetical protein DCS75_06720, partial [Gemmatimonadetes bacterium]|nr:hypothetical protein [Gemmatimonadota bacterium]
MGVIKILMDTVLVRCLFLYAVHPLLEALLVGQLPQWAVVGVERRAHMDRVSALLNDWAMQMDLSELERRRWLAAGQVHDLLRDSEPSELRETLPSKLVKLPGPILHGPAVAERLRREGVDDGELLIAVAQHSLGDVRFGRLGRALYAADFLEPGRAFLPEWRAELRERMP